MAEEKTTYLKPIEKDVPQEHPTVQEVSEATTEKPVTPESHAEHATEVKGESETLYQKILSAVSTTTAPQSVGDVDADAQKVSLKIDADSKVSQLVDLATTKGVIHAVKVARSLSDFYVLDQLHDDLANKLYEALKAKGLIQSE